MVKKRKYLKVRAQDVDLAGEPLPDWVAVPGGFATLGTTGKLESSQLPGITNLTSLGLAEGSDIDNLPYIGGGLITYKLLNVTYKGTFPAGITGSGLNGSVLNQYSWSDQVVYQELFLYINQNNTKCYRQKFSGVWTGWATVMNTSKANIPYGFLMLDANRKIGLNFVPSEVCPTGFIGIGSNSITPSLYNGLLGKVHNVLEQVINESNIVGFEKSTDLTNWTTVTPAKSIIYLIRGNKRLEQQFLATESCRITIGNIANQCNFKAIEFGITNGGLGFKVKVEGIKNGSSTYTTIYDNTPYGQYVTTWPGNLFLNLNESVTVHPSETITTAYNSIRITLVCVNTKTSNNWYLNFVRWYGGYPLVKEPVTFLDSKLSEDTDGHISFPHGVRAQFFDGRATGLGKDVVSSTNVRDVYNAAAISQLTNYKLTASIGAENLPPTFTNGNGAFLLVNRYDVSSGYMIICNHLKEDGIWICWKKPGTDGFSDWSRLDNGISFLPECNIDNIPYGTVGRNIWRFQSGVTYSGTFPFPSVINGSSVYDSIIIDDKISDSVWYQEIISFTNLMNKRFIRQGYGSDITSWQELVTDNNLPIPEYVRYVENGGTKSEYEYYEKLKQLIDA